MNHNKDHKAEALVFSCIDFRFQEIIRQFTEGLGLTGKSDHIAVAGAIRQLIHPEIQAYNEFLLLQISISMRLHNPRTIYLINHEDCGAYGEDNSTQKHYEDLHKAQEMLGSLYSGIRIVSCFATFDGIVVI